MKYQIAQIALALGFSMPTQASEDCSSKLLTPTPLFQALAKPLRDISERSFWFEKGRSTTAKEPLDGHLDDLQIELHPGFPDGVSVTCSFDYEIRGLYYESITILNLVLFVGGERLVLEGPWVVGG